MEGFMRRLSFGLIFAGLTVAAAHAAESAGGLFVSNLDLSTIRFVHSSTDFLSPYISSESVVLTRTVGIAPVGSGFGSASRLSSIAEPKKETAKATNARWHENSGDDRISLSHLLRVEFKGERLKVTLRPGSALMERGQLKVALRSGSTSILWRKAL
jgi:hypothetical protein